MNTQFYLLPTGTALLAFMLACAGAWVTHVITTISYLIAGTESVAYAILLLVGVFVPPVGMVHGFGVWFGAW